MHAQAGLPFDAGPASMAHTAQLLAGSSSSSESSLSDELDSSSDESECTGSVRRSVPRYSDRQKGKALLTEGPLYVRPWTGVQGASDDDCPAGSSPRCLPAHV